MKRRPSQVGVHHANRRLDLGRQGHILIKETKVNAFGEQVEGADYRYSLRDRNVARASYLRSLSSILACKRNAERVRWKLATALAIAIGVGE